MNIFLSILRAAAFKLIRKKKEIGNSIFKKII